MSTLARIGLVELAVGAVLGWVVALNLTDDAAAWMRRLRISSPRRLLQCHIDYLMMGLILIAVAAVAPHLAGQWQGLLVAGSIANPAGFLVLAFGEKHSKNPVYRAFVFASFSAMSGSLVAIAAVA